MSESERLANRLAEHVRNIEIEVGRIMRRQTGEFEMLRSIIEKLERIERVMGLHDKWERKRAAVEDKA